jgi:hypothetical protein
MTDGSVMNEITLIGAPLWGTGQGIDLFAVKRRHALA